MSDVYSRSSGLSIGRSCRRFGTVLVILCIASACWHLGRPLIVRSILLSSLHCPGRSDYARVALASVLSELPVPPPDADSSVAGYVHDGELVIAWTTPRDPSSMPDRYFASMSFIPPAVHLVDGEFKYLGSFDLNAGDALDYVGDLDGDGRIEVAISLHYAMLSSNFHPDYTRVVIRLGHGECQLAGVIHVLSGETWDTWAGAESGQPSVLSFWKGHPPVELRLGYGGPIRFLSTVPGFPLPEWCLNDGSFERLGTLGWNRPGGVLVETESLGEDVQVWKPKAGAPLRLPATEISDVDICDVFPWRLEVPESRPVSP